MRWCVVAAQAIADLIGLAPADMLKSLSRPLIDRAAHGGGAVIGLVAGIWFRWRMSTDNGAPEKASIIGERDTQEESSENQ